MAKANIWQWSETPADNSEIDGTPLANNVMRPSDVNDAFREMMSQTITMEGKGADVSSGGTVALGTERYYHITGTTTITDIDFTDAVDGRWAWLIFDGALTLTHNATTLQLPGGANITTAAGDRALFVQDATDNVICLVYQRAAIAPALVTDYGTYTPTLTNVANVAAATSAVCQYVRIGDRVIVSGNISIDPTAGATVTTFTCSVPVATTFGTFIDAGGSGSGVAGAVWLIKAAGGSGDVTFQGTIASASNQALSFILMYQVI